MREEKGVRKRKDEIERNRKDTKDKENVKKKVKG